MYTYNIERWTRGLGLEETWTERAADEIGWRGMFAAALGSEAWWGYWVSYLVIII